MQSLCPQIPRLWVSLAGRNYPPVSVTRACLAPARKYTRTIAPLSSVPTDLLHSQYRLHTWCTAAGCTKLTLTRRRSVEWLNVRVPGNGDPRGIPLPKYTPIQGGLQLGGTSRGNTPEAVRGNSAEAAGQKEQGSRWQGRERASKRQASCGLTHTGVRLYGHAALIHTARLIGGSLQKPGLDGIPGWAAHCPPTDVSRHPRSRSTRTLNALHDRCPGGPGPSE